MHLVDLGVYLDNKMDKAKPIIQNLQQNGMNMSDTDFNSALTQLAGLAPEDKQQQFGQWADGIRKFRTAQVGMQAAQNLDQNLQTMPNDQFMDQLTKATTGLKAGGASPDIISQQVQDLTHKRLSGNADGAPQGLLQSTVSGIANMGARLGLLGGESVLKGMSVTADSIGSFLKKYAPAASGLQTTGSALQSASSYIDRQVQQANEGGINTGYTGVVAPEGAVGYTANKAGATSWQEAVTRGSIGTLGDVISAGAMAIPGIGEGATGIALTAGAMGLGAAGSDVGQGATASQAAQEGLMTTATGAIFGTAAHVAGAAASSLLNKFVRSDVGNKLMSGIGVLESRQNALLSSGAVNTDLGQAQFEQNAEQLAIAKTGVIGTLSEGIAKPKADYFNQMASEVRAGSNAAYTLKNELYGQVFNTTNRLTPETDLAGTIAKIDDVGSKIGIRNGSDLGEMAGINPKSIPGGISPEELQTIEAQGDLPPEGQKARGAFVTWQNKLRNILTRSDVSTASLQSYLEAPEAIKGTQFEGMANQISQTLRSDMEGYFKTKGLDTRYNAAAQTSKEISEIVQTKLRSSIFGSSPEQFISDLVSKSPGETEIQGITAMLDPKTLSGLQSAAINEVKRQADNEISTAMSSGDPEPGYKAASSIIDKYVKNYGGTDFLTNSDRTNLLTWSQALKADFSQVVPQTIGTGGKLAQKVKPQVQTANAVGQKVAVSQSILEGLQQKDPTLVTKAFDKLTPVQKGLMFSSLPDDFSRQSIGNVILGEKLNEADDFIKAVEENGKNITKEEAESALGSTMNKFKKIMDDKQLWNNGLTAEQRSTITDSVNTYEALSTLQGTQYMDAMKRLATAPLLTAMNHPMAGVMELLRGSKDIITSITNNIGEVSPQEQKIYDSIMQGAGKQSALYKTYVGLNNFIKNNPNMGLLTGGSALAGPTLAHYISAATDLLGRQPTKGEQNQFKKQYEANQ